MPQIQIKLKYSREIKVGLFTIAGLVLLYLGYNFLRGFNPLLRYNVYHIVYKDVSGIVKSTQVTINGLKVGQVEDITMLNEGDASAILVSIFVDKSIQLPVGTTATITTPALIGTTDIVIKPSTNSVFLSHKDTLVAGYQESLSNLVQTMVTPLKDKSEQVLATLDKVLISMNSVFDSTGTRNLSSGIDDFSGTLHNMRSLTGKLNQLTTEEYTKLTGMIHNMEAITKNLRDNNKEITQSLKNVTRITDSVAAADLAATINHTRDVMKEFSNALEKVNRGEGSLGKLANDDSLYVNVNNTSKELSLLLKDMQEYPGRYVNVSVFGGNKRATKQDKAREEAKKKK